MSVTVWRTQRRKKNSMRRLALALLLVNVVLAGFGLVRSPGESSGLGVLRDDALPGYELVYLLSELDAGKHSLGGRPDQHVDTADEGCWRFGPFTDPVAETKERLAALGIETQFQPMDKGKDAKDYRVLLPPADSSAAAYQLLRELKAQQLDSFVIPEGFYALGISLGVFSTLAAAQKVQGEFRELGYAAEIAAILRQPSRYFLVSTDSITLSKLREAGVPEAFQEQEPVPCPTAN